MYRPVLLNLDQMRILGKYDEDFPRRHGAPGIHRAVITDKIASLAPDGGSKVSGVGNSDPFFPCEDYVEVGISDMTLPGST